MSADFEARVLQPGERSATTGLPGMWAAIVIAAITALGIGYWAQPGQAAPGEPSTGGASQIAEVAPQEIPAALETVDAPPKQLEQFKEKEACKRRLAWVSVVRAPGQPVGRIRLQSGRYFSPSFELTEVPIRVALPYPAPYPAGRGTISVVGTTTDAIVALNPPWHVSSQGGGHAKEVTWTPVGACPPGKT